MHPIDHFCCQNKSCPDQGQRGHGNLYFRGWSGQGQRIRMVYCRTCKQSFSERKGTPLEDCRLPPDKARALLEHLREGCGTRATSRLVKVDKNTVTLLTSDEHAPYATAIEEAYHQLVPVAKRPGPGRPPKPKRVLPPELCYATVCKQREKGRVVEIRRTLVFGRACVLALRLGRSTVSQTVNTAFVERNNGTDRRQNGRKHRKTYGFSKDAATHDAATYFIGSSYNFCWAVRTLEIKDEAGRRQTRTPALAAGLTDHVWTLQEWLTFPAKPC